MSVIDDLLIEGEVRSCLQEIWAEESKKARHWERLHKDASLSFTPRDRSSGLRFMKQAYLTQLHAAITSRLDEPAVVTTQDFFEALENAIESDIEPGNWAWMVDRFAKQMPPGNRWEPFPIGRIAGEEPYEDPDFSMHIGSVLWSSRSGNLKIIVATTSDDLLFGRAVGEATPHALESFSKTAEQSLIAAARASFLAGAFESEEIDYDPMTSVKEYCSEAPFIGDCNEWEAISPWLSNGLTLAFDTSPAGPLLKNRLARASRFLVTANDQKEAGVATALCVAAAEALLCNRQEYIRRQFVNRGAVLLENDSQLWKAAQDALGHLYERRSDFVHGTDFEVQDGEWSRLRSFCVASELLYRLSQQDRKQRFDEWIKDVDAAYENNEGMLKPLGDSFVRRLWRSDELKPSRRRPFRHR